MLGQMRSVEAALKAADEERICALAKRLVTSTGCVLLCGAGAAAGIAESAGSALVELGIRAVCPQNPKPGRHIPRCSVKETLCSASVPKEAGKARSN